MGSFERPIGVRGETGRLPRSELLCRREFDLAADGRLDDGLPLEEVPDVERDVGRPEDGLDDGREPLDGGRFGESMSLLHSEWIYRK